MTNTNEWRINDGTVPEGVGPDTVIELKKRDGWVLKSSKNSSPDLWTIKGWGCDIICWRFV